MLDGVVGHEANHFPHVVVLKPCGFAASAGVDEVGNVLEAAQLREAGDGGSLCWDREALLFGGTPDGSHAFERDGIESGLCRLAAGPLVNALAALVCVSHIASCDRAIIEAPIQRVSRLITRPESRYRKEAHQIPCVRLS